MTHDAVVSHSQASQARSSLPGVAMILIGVAAIVLPAVAGVGVSVLFGVAVLLAGMAYGVLAFGAGRTSLFVWRLLVSVVFTLIGLDVIFHPEMALTTITILVAAAFFVEGVAEIGSFVALRQIKGSGLLLVNALFSLVLACLIWRSWPSSSAWAIGTLVGINFITTGLTRLRTAPRTS